MKYLGLLIAVVIAIAAAYFVLQMSQPKGSESPRTVEVTQQVDSGVEQVDIYVAARDIPIGSQIEPNMLTTRPWPKHLVVEGFVVGPEQGEKIIQTIARASFRREEPINKAKLVNPQDPNFLAGELPKGMRVVTMQIDEISGLAGFVFPGDRVDVLITHPILKEGVTEREVREARDERDITEEVTETLLHDIRVLAVDQRATGGIEEEEGVIIPRSISLEVSPEAAQRIKLGAEIGELALALRSVEDKETIETVAITRQSDLTQFKMNNNRDNDDNDDEADDSPVYDGSIRIIRGTSVEVLDVQ